MGKNYDAYVKAIDSENQTKLRAEAVNGGATKEAIQEAKANVEKAALTTKDAWSRMLQDPNG